MSITQEQIERLRKNIESADRESSPVVAVGCNDLRDAVETLKKREKRLDWYQDVHDFHRKFNCLINDRPTLPPENTARLRAAMEREELGELHDATNDGDFAGIADAIADLIYVLLGRAVSYGIDMRPVWAAVHEANMNKVGGSKRSDGKVMKPEGWEPPDIEAIIARQAAKDSNA